MSLYLYQITILTLYKYSKVEYCGIYGDFKKAVSFTYDIFDIYKIFQSYNSIATCDILCFILELSSAHDLQLMLFK